MLIVGFVDGWRGGVRVWWRLRGVEGKVWFNSGVQEPGICRFLMQSRYGK
jgi:hypothetical protein